MAEEGKIYVGNFPYDTSQDELFELFKEYGAIDDVNIIEDRETGRPKGFAFVTFSNAESAKNAILALDQKDFKGRSLKVNEPRPRGGGGGGGGRY